MIWVIHHHQGCMEQCLRAQYSTIPWSTPSIQCWLPLSLLPTSTGHLWHCRTTHTNRVKPRLHGTSHHRLYHGHANQENSPTEYPTLSGCQSWPTHAPRQVVYQGPSLAEVSSSHGGTQRNGYHCYLRGEEWSRWILVATRLFHLGPHHCLFQFFHKLLFLVVFKVLNFQSRFEAPNRDSMPKLHPS